ncbi:MAG: M15 family metallopeptidase [Vicingaceae bacterium]
MTIQEYCKMVDEREREIIELQPKIPIIENASPLVSLLESGLDLIFEPSVKSDYQYLVREELIEKIGNIAEALEEQDKTLIIRSGWRSFQHQRLLWEKKVAFLQKKEPERSLEEIHKTVSQYIAPFNKSMHATGGAVDALIYDLNTDDVMDFGTNQGMKIDLNQECYPHHPGISEAAKASRKLLMSLFEQEDFVCDAQEYWHYDFGNANWAIGKNKKFAFYGIIKE